MNTILADAAPEGHFEEISIHQDGWHERLMALIRANQGVQYDVYELPNLPTDVVVELGKRSYRDFILKSNRDRHFLVPPKGMQKRLPNITDAKSCSPEEGLILIQNDNHVVQVGNVSAIILCHNWSSGTVQHQVRLDFGSSKNDRKAASSEARMIIEKLFAEHVS